MKYTIEPTRMGLYVSIDDKGNRMVTGLTEEAVKYVTDNIHIPVLQGTFAVTLRSHAVVSLAASYDPRSLLF